MTAGEDARLVWSAIAEPADEEAGWLVGRLGHEAALAWVREAARDPVGATVALAAEPARVDRVLASLGRWTPRLDAARPDELRERAARVGARIIVPGEPGWPRELDDLGEGAPHALWVRGDVDLAARWPRSVAVVGSRAATAYGEHVAAEIAAVAADAGLAVVSGGAYGIDAAAHRGALTAGGVTVAVLAGGVDRLYPAGNAALLARVIATGAVVSEQPLGFAPQRQRFLSRNRLIASAGATVVVEAAHRSGALSTARHAGALHRTVAAVPGPLTSAASVGCHRLVRDHEAELLAAPADVLELALPVGEAPDPDGPPGDGEGFRSRAERQAFGAIPRRGAPLGVIAIAAGLTEKEAQEALGALAGRGLARAVSGVWTRADAAQGA
ncbi:DNA-processing protein DprA [Demequina sp. SYSU T00192]|uniref:DNA-processing protein DprA n=1 Tax=Demequina litoralis TaxID=3051660 RepID=A0ABT8G984_9MICO|nr:DNA-processing protein DprA [Demequina sp. SYSU T00192]MDN4475700.1 DNA-processing protein DprA [Demequina sp. SYSU T00192]